MLALVCFLRAGLREYRKEKKGKEKKYEDGVGTYNATVLIPGIHHLRHRQHGRHRAGDVEARLVEMVEALDVLEDEFAGGDGFVPDLVRGFQVS